MLCQNRQAYSLLDVPGWVLLLAMNLLAWAQPLHFWGTALVCRVDRPFLVDGMRHAVCSILCSTSKFSPGSTRTHSLELVPAMLCIWGLSQVVPSSGVRSGLGEPSALCLAGSAGDNSMGLWSWLSAWYLESAVATRPHTRATRGALVVARAHLEQTYPSLPESEHLASHSWLSHTSSTSSYTPGLGNLL